MNYTEMERFAVASAEGAVDSWTDFPTLQDSIDAHEQNVIDTANQHGHGSYYDIERLLNIYRETVAAETDNGSK